MNSTITFIINNHQRSFEITKVPIEQKLKVVISDQKWAIFCNFCKTVFGFLSNDQIDITEEIGFDPDESFDDEFIAQNSIAFITTIFKEFEKLNKQKALKSQKV